MVVFPYWDMVKRWTEEEGECGWLKAERHLYTCGRCSDLSDDHGGASSGSLAGLTEQPNILGAQTRENKIHTSFLPLHSRPFYPYPT